MTRENTPRLRPHPQERFSSPQHLIDVDEAARELASEHPPAHGHRQKTLYRHGGLTLALFLFESGAGLAEHRADGVVTIQVLEGHITVQAEGEEHNLTRGRLLVLAPGVKHDVHAEQQSKMLLIVNREAQ